MAPRYTNAGINLTPDSLASLEAEAKALGKDKSAHGRSIIEAHLAGESGAAVRRELTDLSTAIDQLRTELREAQSRDEATLRLEAQMSALQEGFRLLMAAVHHTVAILFDQTAPTKPEREQALAAFDVLRKQYRETPGR